MRSLSQIKEVISYSRGCSSGGLLLSGFLSQSSETSDGSLGGEGGGGGKCPGASSDGLLASSAFPNTNSKSLHGVLFENE